MQDSELIRLAADARANAYAPYSRFAVGCALQAADGHVFVGCNVENASYSATICAERVAFGTAIASGAKAFKKMALVGGKQGQLPNQPCPPCGVCRQVMREFCDDSFEILTCDENELKRFTLAELLPHSFSEKQLGGLQ